MDESDDKKIGTSNVALTRREALATIGGAALLYGLPHSALDNGTAEAEAVNTLPPGLYAPALDHLTHALSSNARFVAIPAGTQTEYIRPSSAPFVPQALAPREFALVRRLIEIILGDDLQNPDTYQELAEWIDTVAAAAPAVRSAARNLSPEHRALAIAYFANEEEVTRLETFVPEQICREGLAWINEQAQRRFTKSFLEVDKPSQLDLVHSISELRSDASTDLAGRRLFDFLREECVRGFYTSEPGLKELAYKGNAFYSQPPGCGLTPES